MKKLLLAILGSLMIFSLPLSAYAQESDTENPSDVEELNAAPLNAAIVLDWSAATDDTAVTGYQVYWGLESVDEPGESYDFNEDVGDVLEFIVDELENDTLYYFSIVAYDAAGNESIAWAPEASATPDADAGDPAEEDGDDTEAPQVVSAEASYTNTVLVVFSEEVVLPSENPEDAFNIENQETLESLDVTAAEVDSNDGKTVVLTTADQSESVEYKLTVGIDVGDKADNPMISGTSDTAVFDGSSTEQPSDDAASPKLLSVENVDSTHVLLNFDEEIVLGVDPPENFKLLAEDDASVELTILGVELGNNAEGVEDSAALLTTSDQEARSYIVIVSGITDVAANEIEPADGSQIFQGMGEGLTDDTNDNPDAVEPKDVAEFLANKIFEAGEYVVKLSWKIPAGQAANILEQIVYMSQDKGENYGKRATLPADATEYEVKGLDPGEYWFRITQLDNSGNETEGVIAKLILPETGPGLIGLVLGSLGLGHVITRRKKRKI